MTQAIRDSITVGQLGVRFLIEGSDSGGASASSSASFPRIRRMPVAAQPRRVRGDDLRARGRDHMDRRRRVDGTFAPGEAVCIPRGAVHRFDNKGSEDAKFLAIQPRRHHAGLFP